MLPIKFGYGNSKSRYTFLVVGYSLVNQFCLKVTKRVSVLVIKTDRYHFVTAVCEQCVCPVIKHNHTPTCSCIRG